MAGGIARHEPNAERSRALAAAISGRTSPLLCSIFGRFQ
jgi:hypothetical protein